MLPARRLPEVRFRRHSIYIRDMVAYVLRQDNVESVPAATELNEPFVFVVE
ncbi:hypothetical protein [Mycobacterium sp. NPDC050853]|uniref:hypothetical protein n=1 Tax=Mycobacteriaceae TaxID=1762 RepID=UPI0015E03BA1|nr:hypothetical protein [Mycobacteroides sp. LB1]